MNWFSFSEKKHPKPRIIFNVWRNEWVCFVYKGIYNTYGSQHNLFNKVYKYDASYPVTYGKTPEQSYINWRLENGLN